GPSQYQLYTNPDLTGSPISISGGSGENHRLVPTDQAGVAKDTSNRFDPATDVDYGTSRINLPYSINESDGTNSCCANGDAVVYRAGGGTPSGGLVDGGEYYIGDKSGTSVRLYTKDPQTGTLTLVTLTNPGPNAGRSHSIVPSGRTPSGDSS